MTLDQVLEALRERAEADSALRETLRLLAEIGPEADPFGTPADGLLHLARTLNDQGHADRFRHALAAVIAEKVAADPSLLDRAVEVLDGDVWRSDYESQWRAIVAAGPEAVVGVLTSRHPGLPALKADSPFSLLRLVNDDERQQLLEASYER